MSRIRNVGGKITKTTGGDHNIYSDGNIIDNAVGIISETSDVGISFGTPRKSPKPKITDLKVTKVEGPFDENMKLVEDVKIGESYMYKVTPSRKPNNFELNLLKWSIKCDKKKVENLSEVASLNQLASDGTIILNIIIKQDCEKAKVYAYFNYVSKNISIEIIISLIKITITSEITGYTIQSLKGEDYIFSDPSVVVPTYKVNVLSYNNVDKTGKNVLEFNVTRDAWYNLGKNKNGEYQLLNRAFVPEKWSQNLYSVFWIPSYPNQLKVAKSGMDAFIFTRFGERKIPAKPLKTQFKSNGEKIDDFRKDENFATDVMIHIGGTYELKGYDHVGGSYGCFGFIPQDDIYANPKLAKKASENDDYDDITSNSDWKKIANKIVNLSFSKKTKLRILLECREEELNYYPTEVLSE
jgi:ASC-1-like (ASCH) protein